MCFPLTNADGELKRDGNYTRVNLSALIWRRRASVCFEGSHCTDDDHLPVGGQQLQRRSHAHGNASLLVFLMQAQPPVTEIALSRAAVWQLFGGFVEVLRVAVLNSDIQVKQDELESVLSWTTGRNQKAKRCQSACDVIYGTTLSVYANVSLNKQEMMPSASSWCRPVCCVLRCAIRQVGRALFLADVSPRSIQRGDTLLKCWGVLFRVSFTMSLTSLGRIIVVVWRREDYNRGEKKSPFSFFTPSFVAASPLSQRDKT